MQECLELCECFANASHNQERPLKGFGREFDGIWSISVDDNN